jgi:hypothetical protein
VVKVKEPKTSATGLASSSDASRSVPRPSIRGSSKSGATSPSATFAVIKSR